MRVYLSGPIAGLTYEEADGWRQDITDKFRPYGIETINPLRRRLFFGTAEGEDATPNEIVQRDLQDVRSADLELIWLPRMSIGTIMEIWESYRQQKPIILVTGDAFIASHPWIVFAATRIFSTMGEAVNYITRRWNETTPYVPDGIPEL